MLNISKHFLGRNGGLLPTDCQACWNFSPQCMKLLGNLKIWHTVLDWCLAGSFSQTLLGHNRVQISDLTQIYSSWIAAKFKCVAPFIGLMNGMFWALCSLYFITKFDVTKLCQKNLTVKDLTQPIFVCADSTIPSLIVFGHCRAWLAGLSQMKLQKSLEQLPKNP